MANRRNRRVSHNSPDASKMATSRSKRVRHISPDTSKAATVRNQEESHIGLAASKRIAALDMSKLNGRTKSRKGEKAVPKSASYCSCHLLRNARHSIVKFFRIARVRMAQTFRLISRRDSGKDDRDPSRQKFAPARDSHQSEAVEDCIAFMNSSSRKYE